ncbi:hypothetical protein RCH06_001415 [Polaromonas sp. CG_9.5]|uniref:hypothetical protein n=1 Tax=Polaromonas sp. CG_9.5 TaxID=3071705 RepID=UPI002DFA8CB4|nr:hypothetical protein [Polaromonas sp. CG_9.5]
MKSGLLTFSALTALSAVLSMTSLPAQAIGRLADISIVDRDTGATLPVHYARGEYWVAGRPGARYAVNVKNRTGERMLAVPSVDGVNVVSGETASWEQNGYVFSAYERYQITGWRKSNSEIAAFEFSSAGNSYAGRTGRPANVGVIGVALFREKHVLPPPPPPPPPPHAYPAPQRNSMNKSDARSSDMQEPAGSVRDAPPPAPAAPVQERAAQAESQDRSDASSSMAKAPSPRAKLGTAHGQRETSVVTKTTFRRLQAQPNEVISIRYDSRENLIAAGVIRAPVRQPMPNAFPQSDEPSYVPDPPGN